jgi:hypothetical protein
MNMENLRFGAKRETAARPSNLGLEKRPVKARRHAAPNESHAPSKAPQKHGLFDQWQPVRHRQCERRALCLRESTDCPTHERGKMLLSGFLIIKSPNARPTPHQITRVIALRPRWSL